MKYNKPEMEIIEFEEGVLTSDIVVNSQDVDNPDKDININGSINIGGN